MGIFGLFGGKKDGEQPATKITWHPLTDLSQLETIREESKTQPVAIFKHSTRCGISRMTLRQFERSFDLDTDQMKMYYLDLLAYRSISDEVGIQFQVVHQSPQLIIIKNGQAVAHASHYGIQASELQQFV